MSDTKVKMDMIAKTIELEGSEAFVTKYLEEFKAILLSAPPTPQKEVPVKARKGKRAKSPAVLSDTEQPNTKVKRKAAAKLVVEKYDIHGGSGKPSLDEFFTQKNPSKANGDRIAVIGYYITEVLGHTSFSEGQIEYSFKMLKLDRPTHIRQIMINTKNEKDYYEPVENEQGKWSMTRGGDIFVCDKLPPTTLE